MKSLGFCGAQVTVRKAMHSKTMKICFPWCGFFAKHLQCQCLQIRGCNTFFNAIACDRTIKIKARAVVESLLAKQQTKQSVDVCHIVKCKVGLSWTLGR